METQEKPRLTTTAKVLGAILVVYVLNDLLLTPLGMIETRPIAEVTTLGLVTLALLFVGLAVVVVAIVLLLRRSRSAPMVAIVGLILFFPAFAADQTGHFSSLPPPTGIVYVEIFQVVVALIGLTLAIRVFQENGGGTPARSRGRGRS